jgi:putative ABC transport system permease protein
MTLYRLLLLVFPRRVRRECGDDMERMFDEQRRLARAAGQSVTRLWIEACADVAVHGGAERIEGAAGRLRQVGDGLRRWRFWMAAFVHDLRYAARLLRAQPGVTAVAILTLALGIGANTAIFSAVDAILLRPLPYDDPDRLVMVWEKRAAEGTLNNFVAPADYLDWARMNGAFEAMAGAAATTVDLTRSGEPVRLDAMAVSPAFFDILRARPALGRTFAAGEDQPGRNRVVVLDHGFWQERFGANPGIVGQTIVLSGVAHEVVGVLPASFEFPDPAIALWLPLVLQGGPQPPSRANHELNVYARLKPGVTVDSARAEMDRVAAQLSADYPDTNRRHGAWVSPLRDEVTSPVRSGLLLLLGAVAFVLLIACVNVANILLARATARRREMAVRAAIGASRARLLGQTLTESLLLGFVGGVASLIVAHWGIVLLRVLRPDGVPILGLERVALDGRVLAFSFVLSLLTGVLFGLLPAWHLASQNVNDALRDGGRSPAGVRRRLRMALVVSEIALASLLLVAAGLTVRSFGALLNTQPGFSADGVITAMISLPGARYRDPERLVSTFDGLEQRFRSIAGVRAVGGTSHLPLSGQDSRRGIMVEGYVPPPNSPTRAHPRMVTPGYFGAMGLQLVGGRTFTVDDRPDAPGVAIVNETMARRYWPDASPIGKRVAFVGTGGWREVVGIVRDVRHWGVDQPVNPEMYVPFTQLPPGRITFALATDGDPRTIVGPVREELRAVDPDLPLSNVRTMSEVAGRSMAARRATMLLLGVFGALALVLAAAGIFGVMAHLVALRTSEIGVRMTLGALPANVLRLVLTEGLLQAAAGLIIGLAGAVFLMRSLGALLYGVGPADPLTLAGVAAILLATATLACLVPARRAMRVDPISALRG